MIAVVASLASMGAQDGQRFDTSISLVRVDAEVTDGTRTLTGLKREDFQILDNGKLQEILYFSESEEPLDLILLFDTSISMEWVLDQISKSARIALGELRPGDRVSVMSFSMASHVITKFTDNFDEVERAIYGQVLNKMHGGTAIMTAVDGAVAQFRNMPRQGRRRAVLIITDNLGMRTRREGRVVRKYWEADAVLSGIILTNRWLEAIRQYRRFAPQWRLLGQGFTGVADKTGGDVLKGSDPAKEFQESLRRLRKRYSIYYRLPAAKAGGLREVTVDLSAATKQRLPTVRVRARKGYLVPKDEAR